MFPQGTQIRVFFGLGWHHGIYIGDDKVIHLSAEVDGSSLKRKRNSCVHETTLDKFCNNNGPAEPVFKSTYPCGDDFCAVERAKSKLGTRGYQLLSFNCEHFAVYCKTGYYRSTQISGVMKNLVQGSHDSIISVIPIIGEPIDSAVTLARKAVTIGSVKFSQHYLHKFGGQAREVAKNLEF